MIIFRYQEAFSKRQIRYIVDPWYLWVSKETAIERKSQRMDRAQYPKITQI